MPLGSRRRRRPGWGRRGRALPLAGVSFFFIVDGIKIRVDTFTSNQRQRMDSDYILTGISKADMMVKMLAQARANSKEV